METSAAILSIAIVLTLSAMSPGPSFLMVARTALAVSRKDGLVAAVGMGVGDCSFPLSRFSVCLPFSPPFRCCISGLESWAAHTLSILAIEFGVALNNHWSSKAPRCEVTPPSFGALSFLV